MKKNNEEDNEEEKRTEGQKSDAVKHEAAIQPSSKALHQEPVTELINHS